jgi:hypothetical protein
MGIAFVDPLSEQLKVLDLWLAKLSGASLHETGCIMASQQDAFPGAEVSAVWQHRSYQIAQARYV